MHKCNLQWVWLETCYFHQIQWSVALRSAFYRFKKVHLWIVCWCSHLPSPNLIFLEGSRSDSDDNLFPDLTSPVKSSWPLTCSLPLNFNCSPAQNWTCSLVPCCPVVGCTIRVLTRKGTKLFPSLLLWLDGMIFFPFPSQTEDFSVWFLEFWFCLTLTEVPAVIGGPLRWDLHWSSFWLEIFWFGDLVFVTSSRGKSYNRLNKTFRGC